MTARTSVPVRALRLLRVAVHIARGVITVARVFPSATRQLRDFHVRRWSAQLLGILGIQVEISGTPPDGKTGSGLMIANHVSWLDVYVINSVRAARFVAKSEIRHWPVLGWFSQRVGTLFIERTRRRHILTVNRELGAALEQGDTFVIFPEGTTTRGDVLLPFHGSLLQPVLTCGARLQPIAIRYARHDGSLCSEADYRMERSLLGSLLLVVSQPTIRVRLHFLPEPQRIGRHRRDVAHDAAHMIAGALGVPMVPHYTPDPVSEYPEYSRECRTLQPGAELPS